MSDSTTPICDLIEKLMSRGLSGTMALEAARAVEETIVRTTMASASVLDRREYERSRKAAWRANSPGQSPGHKAEGIIYKSKKDKVKEEKKESVSLNVPDNPSAVMTPADDWVEDYLEQFWKAFPPFRRESKRKVGEKLARIRAAKVVTWEALIAAVKRYAGTDPGQFASAPLVWLNGEKWDREFGGGNNAKAQSALNLDKTGFAGIAARLRYGSPAGPERPAPEDLEPINRR